MGGLIKSKNAVIKISILVIIITILCLNKYINANSEPIDLYVTANNDENNVQLEWKLNNSDENEGEYSYKIYRSKDNENDFKPISTTSFEKTKSSKVKVLNVYPGSGEQVEFIYKDGSSETLPKSALLKVWMEGGTIKYPSGKTEVFDNYGRNPKNNEQIIFVDLILMDDFNANPDIINNYDVCMFGTWDYNGEKDLTLESKAVVEDYIKTGKGILCGHDTVGDVLPNFWSLRDYFKISKYSEWDFGTKVIISKKGLLTNFPWEIGDVGTVLTVPQTHNKQSANGDIWIQFDRQQGPDNFYLTTYQNTALIQTGHSKGNSTEDERKVLANTLFYLNQLTNATSVIDNGGQDLAEPDSVSGFSNSVSKSTQKVSITFNKPNDNETKYTYYVEGKDNNNNIIKSNEKSVSVKTGIKGYNYLIDNNPSSEAGYDINLTKELIENIDIDWNKTTYLHIRSIDGGKNYSTTSHYKIEYKNIIDDEENNGGESPNPAPNPNPNPKPNPKPEKDTSIATGVLPNTGASVLITLLAIITIWTVVNHIKNKKYKDI